jgi:hypothetical protein
VFLPFETFCLEDVGGGEEGGTLTAIEPWYLGLFPTYRVNKHKDRGGWDRWDSCMQIETWVRAPVPTYRVNKYKDRRNVMIKIKSDCNLLLAFDCFVLGGGERGRTLSTSDCKSKQDREPSPDASDRRQQATDDCHQTIESRQHT